MPKTINYTLVKKLYDAGVVIESKFEIGESGKLFKRTEVKYDWAYPAPNCEEAIEFLSDLSDFILLSVVSEYISEAMNLQLV